MSTSFKPMLAKDGDPSKVGFPVVAQTKYDGIRASVVNGVLVSRNLKPIRNAEIQTALGRPEYEGLDGELIVGDPTAPDCFRQSSSYVMAESKTGGDWKFYAFDIWNMGDDSYMRRRTTLAKLAFSDPRIEAVLGSLIATQADLDAYEKAAVDAGHEGIILRTPNAAYKFGRSGKTGPLLKVKRFQDFEATVIGVYERLHNANEAKTNALGRTERSSHKANMEPLGDLGGLILRTDDGVEFRCGTGFDAATRIALWAEAWQDVDRPGAGHTRDGLNGRRAKIKSFMVGVKDKPRFPVFLGFRDEADVS